MVTYLLVSNRSLHSFQKNQYTKAPTLPLTGSILDRGTGGMAWIVLMDLRGKDLLCWPTRRQHSHRLINGVLRTCERRREPCGACVKNAGGLKLIAIENSQDL